jgi:hypothetical protein
MQNRAHIKALFGLFCDDIRLEASGKQILIGVYPGDIVLQSFPATIAISSWVAFTREGNIGEQLSVEFRIINTSGQALGYGSLVLTFTRPGDEGAIALPPLPISLTTPDTLSLQLRQHDGDWQTVRSIGVVRPISDATPPVQPA